MSSDDQDPGRLDVDDPDAMWRPGGATMLQRATETTGRHTAASSSEVEPADDRVNPWSRQASDAPRPRDDELRARWRRELGLEDGVSDKRSVGTAGSSGVARSAVVLDLPPSSATGDVLLTAIVVLLALVVAALVGVSLVPSGVGGADAKITAMRLAPTAERRWSADIDLRGFRVTAGDGLIVVSSPEQMVVYDASDGTERWSVVIDEPAIVTDVAVFDEIVVVSQSDGTTSGRSRGLDASTGDEVWRTIDNGSSYFIAREVDGSPVAVIGVERTLPQQWRRLDPVTGLALGPRYQMSQVSVPVVYLASQTGGSTQVIDVATDTVVGPAVASFDLAALVPLNGLGKGSEDGLVGFGFGGDVIAFDDAGDVTDQRPFVSEAFGDFSGRATLVGPVPGSRMVVVSSGSSIGVEVVDGMIDVRWELNGRVGEPVVTEQGPLSVARLVDETTGEVNQAIVDPLTGDVVAVTDEGVTREEAPMIGDTGYVLAPSIGAADRRVEAVGFDGTPIWSVPLPNQAQFVVGDDVVVVIDRTEQRISVYG